MRVLVSSPLFPPEVSYPAPFTKKLAFELSKKHSVRVLTICTYPEKIEGVKVIAIKKNQNFVERYIAFFLFAIKEIIWCEKIILVQAGIASLIVILISKIFMKKTILIVKGKEDWVRGKELNLKLANQILDESILEQPATKIIYPFAHDSEPQKVTWENYIEKLCQII